MWAIHVKCSDQSCVKTEIIIPTNMVAEETRNVKTDCTVQFVSDGVTHWNVVKLKDFPESDIQISII